MKKVLVLIISMLCLGLFKVPVEAKTSSYKIKAPKSYSVPKYKAPNYSLPRSNSNPKYIVPRKDIPVLKTQPVKPYIKKNGTIVPGHQRAPKDSLKPWYNPTYQKK